MAEYIEREELLKRLHTERNQLLLGKTAAIKLEKFVNALSTADVAPVRHGYWYIIEYEYVNCSECGHMYYTGMESTSQAKQNLLDEEVPNYCPNCGAKMDGKDVAVE